jgi:hypothetical protein
MGTLVETRPNLMPLLPCLMVASAALAIARLLLPPVESGPICPTPLKLMLELLQRFTTLHPRIQWIWTPPRSIELPLRRSILTACRIPPRFPLHDHLTEGLQQWPALHCLPDLHRYAPESGNFTFGGWEP